MQKAGMTLPLKTLAAALLLAAGFLSSAAQAQNAPEDIGFLFCEKMEDESLYDKNHFESYKMLLAGNEGWIFRSQSDLRSDFSLTSEALNDLEALNDAFKERGTTLVMLIPPTRGLVSYAHIKPQDREKYNYGDIDALWRDYEKALESIRKRGIHVVGVPREDTTETFFYKRDHHWKPEGAQISAKILANYIREMPEYADIEKVKYQTKENGPFGFYGVSKKVFKKFCRTDQPAEEIIRQYTERADALSNNDALFGKTKNPAVVLLGTSNSTMEPSFANFEGFLKEELSADILNMSVSGGGLDTAMISYLNSSFFAQEPARIAVWEAPSYYDMSAQKNFFREAIAAVHGTCEGQAVAKSEPVQIRDQTFTILDGLAEKEITSGDYYVSLNFDNPVRNAFYLDLRYLGNREKRRFYRGVRYPADGQFFTELSRDKKEYLEKIVLSVPAEMKGNKVKVAICEKGKNDFIAAREKEPKDGWGVKSVFERLKNSIKL